MATASSEKEVSTREFVGESPIERTPEEMEWDAFVASIPHGFHEQTSGYAKIRATSGFQCDRVIVRKDGGIVAGAQILVQQTPIGKYARVFRAPLARDDDPSILREVVSKLDALARSRSYVSLRVDLFPTQNAAIDALASAGFRSSRAWFGELRSACIDLAQSESEIFDAMKPDARRGVRVARRHHVVVRSNEQTSLDDFYAVRSMTANHAGYRIYPYQYYKYIWQLFAPQSKAHIYTAYYQHTPAGSIVAAHVYDRMCILWLGTNRENIIKKAMGSYLLLYTIIIDAKKRGCAYCDFLNKTFFAEKFLRSENVWPLPMRKFYGPMRHVRRGMMEFCWSKPFVRHRVNTAARRLGLRPKMAY